MPRNSALKKAEKLASNLSLKNIHLWEAQSSRDLSFKSKKVDAHVEIQVSPLKTIDKEILPFACRFKIVGTDKEEGKIAFQLNVAFCAVYSVKNNYQPKKGEIEAFGLTSAVFNVWPYLREHVHTTIVKMNLPALVLPPMTVGQLVKSAKQEEEQN